MGTTSEAKVVRHCENNIQTHVQEKKSKATNHVIALHAEIYCGSTRLGVTVIQIKCLLVAASRPAKILRHLSVIMSQVAERTT